LTQLKRSALADVELDRDRLVTFEFTPPDDSRRLLGAAQPVQLVRGTEPFGWLVVAKPVTELREQWLTLLGRLALALAVGIALAGLLFWWLSRRLTEPVLALARATQDVAAGRYEVEIPDSRGSDEISQLSERFRRMVAKLAEAEQLKRSFLMSVSHELRTPLTAIRGHVEALREGVVSDPEQVESSLEVIASEADRLERLVGDVLDLAKLQAHRFTVRQEEVDLGRVLDHAYSAFTEEARRREIDYRLASHPEPPVIVSDGDRVLQVISNLLSNAFRWTPDGGRIDLELAAGNGAVRVDVADSGPGVPAHERDTIFDAFISHDVNGTGLGLPIARELALALGGRIELQSTPGRGSRFRLVLPVISA
jgi:signal transduction histidine kinase